MIHQVGDVEMADRCGVNATWIGLNGPDDPNVSMPFWLENACLCEKVAL